VLLASVPVIALTLVYRSLHVSNVTTIALTFLLIVLIVAATSRLSAAVATSVVAMLCLNYFFVPPVRSFTVADPENWFAIVVFLTVSLVASNLSSLARGRAEEALRRRDEMARLFDLSRDVLLVTDTREAMSLVARFIASRFDLSYTAICLPSDAGWQIFAAGSTIVPLDEGDLDRAIADAGHALNTPPVREGVGHRVLSVGSQSIRLVPLPAGNRLVGLLAAIGRLEPGTLDAIGGVTAIALERVHFLAERESAELFRKSEELKSALLASLGHDLRTPLTAIRVAATNLQSGRLTEAQRREQSELALAEVERLARLFQNVLEMARIDAGAVGADMRWAHPSEIVEAARDQVARTLAHHRVEEHVDAASLVRVDPRLTAAALAHVLENAAQYSPRGSTITVTAAAADGEFSLSVRDRGPGIDPADLPRIFDRFYRGSQAERRQAGTGMGLSIAKGMLMAESGQIGAQNCAGGGAEFKIVVPAETRPIAATAEQTG
jgi:two-component system sensor histidine kinase KdpD